MGAEPVVREVVENEGDDEEYKRRDKRTIRIAIEQSIAKTQPPGNTTLPSQQESALRRAALAMTAELDKTEQKARANKSQAETHKGGSSIEYNLLRARNQHEQGGYH